MATLDDLKAKAREAAAADHQAATLRQQRDALALDLYEHGGVTYADLAQALGVTRDRVNQVLQSQRRQHRQAVANA